jgi:hypothetical protein
MSRYLDLVRQAATREESHKTDKSQTRKGGTVSPPIVDQTRPLDLEPKESYEEPDSPVQERNNSSISDQSSNGHLNGRACICIGDAASDVAGALQQLFDHNPETRGHAPDRLAMELYYSDYLDQEPSPETVAEVMKMLDRMSSRA